MLSVQNEVNGITVMSGENANFLSENLRINFCFSVERQAKTVTGAERTCQLYTSNRRKKTLDYKRALDFNLQITDVKLTKQKTKAIKSLTFCLKFFLY